MKFSTGIVASLLILASPQVLAAPESCERVRSDIEQRIINNGVAQDSFTLSIVPNDGPIDRILWSWDIVPTTRIKSFTRVPAAATPPPIVRHLRTVTPPNRNKPALRSRRVTLNLICINKPHPRIGKLSPSLACY